MFPSVWVGVLKKNLLSHYFVPFRFIMVHYCNYAAYSPVGQRHATGYRSRAKRCCCESDYPSCIEYVLLCPIACRNLDAQECT